MRNHKVVGSILGPKHGQLHSYPVKQRAHLVEASGLGAIDLVAVAFGVELSNHMIRHYTKP